MVCLSCAIFCIFHIIVSVSAQLGTLDKSCTLPNSQEGYCVPPYMCKFTTHNPQYCGFRGFIPLICCSPNEKNASSPEKSKSKKQCQLWYPKSSRYSRYVSRGTKSVAKEFPHMALLGFGLKEDIKWLCGASLISEWFVLTAAHCLSSQEFGEAKWVRLGELDLKTEADGARPEDSQIQKFFYHPDYKSRFYYNDIGLVKLERIIAFNAFIRPACLFSSSTIPKELIVVGWGKTDFLGESSSHLLKASLNAIGYNTCVKRFKNDRKLNNGIVQESQICAGHPDGRDTCPGDSGGPLQIRATNPVHYYIAGITSFGKACGVSNSIGVYTRVSNFVPWIESIVWPEVL